MAVIASSAVAWAVAALASAVSAVLPTTSSWPLLTASVAAMPSETWIRRAVSALV